MGHQEPSRGPELLGKSQTVRDGSPFVNKVRGRYS